MKVLLVAFLLALAGWGGEACAADSGYQIGADDKLRVTIFDEPNLSGEFSVDGRGNLSLPLVGQVPVGGLTVPEIESLLIQRYSAGFLKNPRVAIDVLTYRPFFILGEVNLPGRYAYVNGMTVITAVAMGGGYTYRADKTDVKIRRETPEGPKELRVKPDSLVTPGDVIEIGERLF